MYRKLLSRYGALQTSPSVDPAPLGKPAKGTVFHKAKGTIFHKAKGTVFHKAKGTVLLKAKGTILHKAYLYTLIYVWTANRYVTQYRGQRYIHVAVKR